MFWMNSIKKKLIFFVLLPVIFLLIFLTFYIYKNVKEMSEAMMLKNLTAEIEKTGAEILVELEKPLNSARTIALFHKNFTAVPLLERRNYFSIILKYLMEENLDY